MNNIPFKSSISHMTNSEDKVLFLIWTRRGDEKFLFDTLFDRS